MEEEKIDPWDEIIKTNKVIETNKLVNFCGGCNNQVELHKFIMVDETESLEEAIKRVHENDGEELFCREIFIGFCPCGNIWLMKNETQ